MRKLAFLEQFPFLIGGIRTLVLLLLKRKTITVFETFLMGRIRTITKELYGTTFLGQFPFLIGRIRTLHMEGVKQWSKKDCFHSSLGRIKNSPIKDVHAKD